jgi:hypothetical protein
MASRWRWCRNCSPRCGHNVKAVYRSPALLPHGVLTLFTVGLWLPVLVLVGLFGGGWHCDNCGRKV